MKPRSIRLPDDMKPHDAVIEWWYFNGHLADAEGNNYAFMDCLFRTDINRVKIPYLKNIFGRGTTGRYVAFAHSVFENIAERKSYKDVQNISLVSRDSFTRPLFYANYIDPVSLARGFLVNEIAERKPGIFHIKTEWIDLIMESKKKPLLEGGQGFITVRDRESFYYSLTDLKTIGSVRLGNEWIAVTGRSWMDHQWADVSYSNDKWTWFSIQLDNGTDIMCVEYDDGKAKDYLADIIDAHGRSLHYTQAVLLKGSKTFKSKTTKAEYPLEWMIAIPEYDLQLKASALLPDGEMIFGAINYWEGSITITGTIGNKKVSGKGFMELAGYPSNYNFLLLSGKKLNKMMKEELSVQIKKFF